MNKIADITDRIQALSAHLKLEIDEIKALQEQGCFEVHGQDWLVLTEEEANLKAYEYVKETLWAFNPSFLTGFMHGLNNMASNDVKDFELILKGMQEKMCESCNPIIRMMVRENFDKLFDKAIEADGRAHFLNTYDGNEYEQGDFFIYRTN